MGKVDTVLGEIDAEDLGMTYIHEHILTMPPLWRIQSDPDYVLDSKEKIVTELASFKKAGGCTILDATAIDYGRNVHGVLEVARQIDVHILMITGFNRGYYQREMIEGKSVSEIEENLLGDVTEGIERTPIKACVVKIGTSYNLIRPAEESVARAAAGVQKRIRVPIMTHTTMGTMALEQLDILEQGGADLTRVAISHMDQNLDFRLHEKIAKRGVSKIKYAPDSERIVLLNRLVDAGYEKNIMISGDMGRRSYLKAYGGGPGFEFLLKKFMPRLREEGWNQSLIEQVFVKNPARYLTYR
jgi:predicted metal-dependent phosphotriesterase family hydrolase